MPSLNKLQIMVSQHTMCPEKNQSHTIFSMTLVKTDEKFKIWRIYAGVHLRYNASDTSYQMCVTPLTKK